MTQDEILDVIEDERCEQGLSVQEMTAKADLRHTTYYKWRLNESSPRLSTLLLILDALGLQLVIERK